MFKKTFLLALFFIGAGQGLLAQEITSVVQSETSDCSTCASSDCGCGTPSFLPDVANRDVWERPFFRDCGAGRVDWLDFDQFCPKNYLSFFGGYSNIDDFQREIDNAGAFDITSAQMLDGWGIGFGAGRQIHPLFRIETEFTYRDHVAGSWREETYTGGVLTATNTVDATGSLDTYTWLNNFVIDFPPRQPGRPNLYTGGGIGIMFAEGNIATATNTYNVSDSSFAYQFLAGVNVPVRERVDFFTEYRFTGATNITVDDVTTPISLGGFDLESHNVFFGLRIFAR